MCPFPSFSLIMTKMMEKAEWHTTSVAEHTHTLTPTPRHHQLAHAPDPYITSKKKPPQIQVHDQLSTLHAKLGNHDAG